MALPPGWKYDDQRDEDVVMFYKGRKGEGALQISAHRGVRVGADELKPQLDLRDIIAKKTDRSV